MRRHLPWWFWPVLLLAVLIGLFALTVFIPRPPLTPFTGAVQVGQEEFARQFALGESYWESWELEEARKAFAEAALAGQTEISEAGRRNVQVVLQEQSSFLGGVRSTLRDLWGWLISSVVALLAVLVLLLLLKGWFNRRTGQGQVQLFPLKDLTPDQAGKGFDQRVRVVLDQARQTHSLAQAAWFGAAQPLDLPILPEQSGWLSAVAAVVETIKIGQISLPLAKIVPFIESQAGHGMSRVVPCLSRSGSVYVLDVHLIRKNDQSTRQDAAPLGETRWEIRAQGENGVEGVARELAFRLLQALAGKSLQTRTWQNLMRFTDGLRILQSMQEEGYSDEQVGRALALFEQVVKEEEGCLPAQFAAAQAQRLLGRWEAAQSTFRQLLALKDCPINVQLAARYGLTFAYYWMFVDWAFPYAFHYLETLREQFKVTTDSDPFEQILLPLVYAGQAAVAAEWCRRPPNRADPLLKDFTDVPANQSRDWYQWGRDRCEQAEKHAALLTGLQSDPANQVQQAILYARGMLELRLAQHLKGEKQAAGDSFRCAAQYFEDLVRLNPEYTGGYIYWGVALDEGGIDRERAKERYRRAGELNLPGSEYAWLQLGDLLAEEGKREPNRLKEAIDAYQRAPHLARAHKALGRLLIIVRDDLPSGLAHLRQATRLQPKYDEAWGDIAWRIVDKGAGDPALLEEALQAAEQCLILTQGNKKQEAHSYMIRARVLAQLGRNQEALTDFQKAVDGWPSCRIAYHLAKHQAALGQVDQAIQTLTLALRHSTNADGECIQRVKELQKKLSSK